MAKKNPCFITYKDTEYSYPEWIEYLYSGGLADMVKSGEVKITDKIKGVSPLAAQKETPRFNLANYTNEDVEDVADAIIEILDEDPSLGYAGVKKMLMDELSDVYEGEELDNFIRDSYIAAANRGTKEGMSAIAEKMNRSFLNIGVQFLSGAKALADKAKELMGMGDVRYNMTINGKDVEVKRVGADVVNGFYSPLEKIISESKQDKMPIKQWMDKFVKGEEAKWTGLLDWLSQQTGSISKQDILNYLKDNRIEIVEVVNQEGGKKPFGSWRKISIEFGRNGWLNDGGYKIKETPQDDYELIYTPNRLFAEEESLGRFDIVKEAEDVAEKHSKNLPTATKFASYQLEGNKENYKEIMVILPRTGSMAKVDDYKVPLAHRYGEDLSDNRRLVHLRMNTRADAKGNKVLFLEEVQSDWGQTGKKEGFFVLTESEKKLLEIAKNDKDEDGLASNKAYSAWDELSEKYGKDKVYEWINNKTSLIPTAPFVMDTNAWTKLGLKAALKEAVAQGVDRIAWTTGTQQFDRWGSEKISWKKEGNKWKLDVKEQVSGTAFEGVNIDEQALSESNVTVDSKERLREILNRNLKRERTEAELNKLTDRIWDRMQKEDSGTSLPRKEGMESFYGAEGKEGIVGGVAKALVKELTGKPTEIVKTDIVQQKGDVWEDNKGNWNVSTVDADGYENTISFSDKRSAESHAELNKSVTTQASIEVTPELKEAVKSGMPLFHLDNKGEILGFSFGNDIYLNEKKLTYKTTFEEAGHIWINWAKSNRPDLYKQGMSKVAGSVYLSEVEKSKEYKAAAKEAGLKEGTEAWNDYMKSEALAKAVADQGAKFVSEARKKNFKNWLDDFWNSIKDFFRLRDMTPEEVSKLTLEEFSRMVAADVFNEKTETQQKVEEEIKQEDGKMFSKAVKVSAHYDKVTAFFKDAKRVEQKYGQVAERLSKDATEYEPISNKSTRQQAIEYLATHSFEEAYEYAGSKDIDIENPTLQPAVAFLLYGELIEQATNAAENGDLEVADEIYEKFHTLMDNVSLRGTKGGQHTQSYRIFAESGIFESPAAAINYFSNINRKNNKNQKNKSRNKKKADNIKKANTKSKEEAKKKIASVVDESTEKPKEKPKKFTLSDSEKKELDDLRKETKSWGGLFDITTIPALFVDPKFRKYARLTLKETGYDLANFTDRLATELGDNVRKYAKKIYDLALEATKENEFNKFINAEEKRISKIEKEAGLSEAELEARRNERKAKREERKAKKEEIDNMILNSNFDSDYNLQRYADLNGIALTYENKEVLRSFAKDAQARLRPIANAKEAAELESLNKKTIEEGIKEGLKNRGLAIKDIANKRIDGQIKTLDGLKQELIDKAGLTDSEATEYADKIESVYREMVNKYLVDTVERNNKKANKIKVDGIAKAYAGTKMSLPEFLEKVKQESGIDNKKLESMAKYIAKLHSDVVMNNNVDAEYMEDMSPFDKLIQLSDSNLLSDDAIMDIFSTKFGINNLSTQNIATISQAVNKAKQTNNPIARQVIINNMIAQINQGKNVSYTDLFKSLWYASVLSGFGTFDLNFSFGIYAWKNFALSTMLTSLGQVTNNLVSGNRDAALGNIKNLQNMFEAFFMGQRSVDKEASEQAKESAYSFFVKNQLYTVTQGSDLFNEQLRELLYNKKNEVDWNDLSTIKYFSFLRHLNYFTKGIPRVLQSIDFFFNSPIKDAMTTVFIYNDEVERLKKEVVQSGNSVTYLGSTTTYASAEQAEQAKNKLISSEAQKKVDEFLYKSEDDIKYAYDMAKKDRLLSDITILNQNNEFVVKDMDKVVGEFPTQAEADAFADKIATEGIRFIKYMDFYKSEGVDDLSMAKARNFASERTLNSTVKGSFGYIYDNVFNRFRKFLAREQLKLKEKSKEKIADKEYLASSAPIVGAYLIQAADFSIAFMRVALNSVRETTNYSPIGYLRAYKNGGVLAKTNLQMWDNAQKNMLLGQATLGTILGAIALLKVVGSDDDDEEKRKKMIEEWNKKHKEYPVSEDAVMTMTPYDGMIVGDMDVLPSNLRDFLKKNYGMDSYSVYDAKSKTFKSYLSDPSKSLGYSMVGTYNLWSNYIDNNPMLSGKSNMQKRDDKAAMIVSILTTAIKIMLAQSNAKGLRDNTEMVVNILKGDWSKSGTNLANLVTSPLEAFRPNIIKSAYSYYSPNKEEYANINKYGIGSYLFSKAPLFINLLGDKHYAYNMFGHKILYVSGEKQGIVAPAVKAHFANTKEFNDDIEMTEFLLSHGYQKQPEINFNSPMYQFYDSEGNLDFLSNYGEYQDEIWKFAGNKFYKKLKENKERLSNKSTTPKTTTERNDITYEKVTSISSDFTKRVDEYWSEAVHDSYDEFIKNHLQVKNGKYYLKDE